MRGNGRYLHVKAITINGVKIVTQLCPSLNRNLKLKPGHCQFNSFSPDKFQITLIGIPRRVYTAVKHELSQLFQIQTINFDYGMKVQPRMMIMPIW